jgi:alpha-amylase
VYSVGEVLNGNAEYVGDYQYHLPGLLNYPLYFNLLGVYGYGDSMYNIRTTINEVRKRFRDPHALGNFVDNHDNARFLSRNSRWEALQAYIAFNLFVEGIPMYYYGTE